MRDYLSKIILYPINRSPKTDIQFFPRLPIKICALFIVQFISIFLKIFRKFLTYFYIKYLVIYFYIFIISDITHIKDNV